MPVRVRIHSSVVSMTWDSSSFVTTRSGTEKPVPRIRLRDIRVSRTGCERARGISWQAQLPTASYRLEPATAPQRQGPDPDDPGGGESPAHAAPGLPNYPQRSEPPRPPGIGAE